MLALGQIVLSDCILSSGYWLCRFSTFLPLPKRTYSYATLGRVHVRMLKWVCVGMLRHIVDLTRSHKEGSGDLGL